MLQPDPIPGVNFVQDPSLAGPAPKPQTPNPWDSGFDSRDYFQNFVNLNPTSQLTPLFIETYGLMPPQPASAPTAGGVRVDITGDPNNPQISHGPLAPRGRPTNPNDPFFAENYGVGDGITPWLIAPGQGQGIMHGPDQGSGNVHYPQYGIPSQSPIAIPQQPAAGPVIAPAGHGEGSLDQRTIDALAAQNAKPVVASPYGNK